MPRRGEPPLADAPDRWLGSAPGRGAALLAVATLTFACGPSGPPPSVLLITIDTLRADRLGVYGYDQPVSANIDQLATRSTVFDACQAPIGTTVPSHASMLTGLYPRAHGVESNRQGLSTEITTLTERLSAEGFDSAAFVSTETLRRSVTEGFDLVRSTRPHNRKQPPARRVTDDFIEWLGERPAGTPFFAWVHFFDPHAPYEPTPYSEGRVDRAEPFAQGISVQQFYHSKWFRQKDTDHVVQTLYDGRVERVDRAIGRILSELEERGLLDAVFLVLTADHGQNLGDHELPGHPSLWNSVLRVPLIVFDGQRPKRSMRRVSTPVSLVDLTPTILDRLDLEPHEGIEGRSLLRALNNRRIRTVPVYGEDRWKRPRRRPGAGAAADQPRPRGVAVRDGELKLVQHRGKTTWFNLAEDPGELEPLPPEQLTERHRGLMELLRDYRARRPLAGSAEIATPEEIELLESLGYIE